MPAKPKRIKAPAIATRAAFEATIDELARVEVDLRKAEARRDAKLQAIRDEFEPAVQALVEQREGLALAAEKYAEEHRGELFPTKLKSAETPLATFGFRLGQPTLKLLNRTWSWDRVLEQLSLRKLTRFIRTKVEPDKEAIKQHLNAEELALIGCRIDQAETFYVEPKDQATAAAA